MKSLLLADVCHEALIDAAMFSHLHINICSIFFLMRLKHKTSFTMSVRFHCWWWNQRNRCALLIAVLLPPPGFLVARVIHKIVMKGYKLVFYLLLQPCQIRRWNKKTNDTAAAFFSQMEQSSFFFKFGWRRFGMIGQNIIRLHNFQIQNIKLEVFFKLKTLGLKIVMHSEGGCRRFCMNFKDSRIL